MKISEMLKEKRMALELSQKEVASSLLVSRQTISNWENDRSYPDLENLVLLSQLYGFSLDELFRMNKEEAKNLERTNRKQYVWSWSVIVACFIIFCLLLITLILAIGGKNLLKLEGGSDIVSNATNVLATFGIGYFALELDKSNIQLPKKMKIILFTVIVSLFLNAIFHFSIGFVQGFLDGVN